MKTLKRVISILMAVFLMLGSLTLPTFPVYAASSPVQVDQKSYTSYWCEHKEWGVADLCPHRCCGAIGGTCPHGYGYSRAESNTWHSNGTTTVTMYKTTGEYPLTLSVSNGGGSWSTPDGVIDSNNGTSISVTNPGTYNYSINYTASGGGTGTCTLSYNVTWADISPCIQLISFDRVNLTLTVSDIVGGVPGADGYKYRMNGGEWQSDPTFSISASGNYVFNAIDSNDIVSPDYTYTIDCPPIINEVIFDTNTATFSISNISDGVSGQTGFMYQMNGGDWQIYNDFAISSIGTYTFKVKDALNQISDEYTYVLDLTPQIDSVVISPSTYTNGDYVILTVAASDGVPATLGYLYRMNGGEWQSDSSFQVTDNGTYTFTVKDYLDTVSAPESFIVSTIDRDDPVISAITMDMDNLWSTPGLTYTIEATDYSPLKYSNGGVTWQDSNVIEITTPGTYRFGVKDAAGNYTTEVVPSYFVKEGNILYVIKFDDIKDSEGNVIKTEITILSPDDGKKLLYSYDGDSYSANFTHTFDFNGTHTVRVKDSWGNIASSEITIDWLYDESAKIKAVEDKINDIGTVTYTDVCKERIDEARQAYDNLPSGLQSKVSNYDKLTDAEAEYQRLKEADEKKKADQAAADAVIEKIKNIGTVTDSASSKQKIEDARKAYDALTADQKALVTNYKTLTDAEAKYKELSDKNGGSNGSGNNTANTNQSKADDVIAKINDIGTVTYTNACKQRIDKARRAYDLLSADQKALVTNYATLVYAEELYESLKPTNTNPSNPGNGNGGTNMSTGTNGSGSTPSTNNVNTNNGGAGSQESQIPSDPNNITEFSARYANDAPLINCVSHSFNSPANIQEVVLYVDATDAKGHTSGLQYSVDGIEWQKDSTFRVGYESEYTVYVKDRYSNTTTEVHAVPIVKPAILGVDQQTEGYGKSVLTIKAEGGEGLEYSLNNGEWTSENAFTVTENGTITVSVRNADGFESSMEVEIYTVEDAPAEEPIPEKTLADTLKEAAIDYWWVAIIVLIAVGGGVALKKTSSKKKKDVVS